MRTVMIRADAPPKPAEGAPCNGCGICCAIERCPVAWLFLPWRSGSSCAALEWDAAAKRYRCGMVAHPARFIVWLPRRWEGPAGRWFASRIATDQGCDCGASEVDRA